MYRSARQRHCQLWANDGVRIALTCEISILIKSRHAPNEMRFAINIDGENLTSHYECSRNQSSKTGATMAPSQVRGPFVDRPGSSTEAVQRGESRRLQARLQVGVGQPTHQSSLAAQ